MKEPYEKIDNSIFDYNLEQILQRSCLFDESKCNASKHAAVSVVFVVQSPLLILHALQRNEACSCVC